MRTGIVQAVILLTWLLPTCLHAQTEQAKTGEASVKPGINDKFIDPDLDVDSFVKRFEIESREIYLARERILAACDIEAGDTGDDRINAGRGNDIIRGGADNDRIVGGAGNDDDELRGGEGADFLYGEQGNDFLTGGFEDGVDLLKGGAGFDTFIQPKYIDDVAGEVDIADVTGLDTIIFELF